MEVFNQKLSLDLSPDRPLAVIDDDEFELALFERCYEKSSMHAPLVFYNSADDFLQHALQVESMYELPALVLLDINMPGLTGFDLLREMRNDGPYLRALPVVMFSISSYAKDLENAKQLGADGYEVKPTLPTDYLDFFAELQARVI